MVAAAVAVPTLLHTLGTESFGVLSISWTLIGYFILFDLGLGRALTRLVAERLGGGEPADLPALVGTAIFMLLALGSVLGLALWLATPVISHRILQVPAPLEGQTRATFHLLAVSLPAVLATAGLGGVLAAYQRFKELNLIRIPLSILSFVLPMAVLPYTHDLAAVVGAIVAVRIVGAVGHMMVCAAVVPGFVRQIRWTSGVAAPLLVSGGWIAVINLIVPLMASVDRLLLGAMMSVSEVAFYTPPQELVTRMWIVPGTLVGVLFPAFATSGQADPARVRVLFIRGLSQVYFVLYPISLLLIVVGGDGLRVWLGADFQKGAQGALRFMAIGGLCTGLSFIPSALIQAVGQPRRVGVLLLMETPLFLLGLWLGIRQGGMTGAAFVWCVRALVDFLALMALAMPYIEQGRSVVRQLVLPALGSAAGLAAAYAIQSLGLPARFAVLAVVLLPAMAWIIAKGTGDERRALKALLERRG